MHWSETYINIRYTARNIIALAQNLGFGLNSLLRIAPLLRLTPMVAFVTLAMFFFGQQFSCSYCGPLAAPSIFVVLALVLFWELAQKIAVRVNWFLAEKLAVNWILGNLISRSPLMKDCVLFSANWVDKLFRNKKNQYYLLGDSRNESRN